MDEYKVVIPSKEEIEKLTLDSLYNAYEKYKMMSLIKIINDSIRITLEKEE